MKRKVGEIYNIPIIIGDKNLKDKNEIHVDELSMGSTGGGSSAFKYYKLNWDSSLSGNMGSVFLYGGQFIVNSVISHNSRTTINAGIMVFANTEGIEDLKAIITCPFPIEVDGEFKTYTIEQFFAEIGAEGSTMFEELLIPITEAEYYNKDTYA